MYLCVSPIFTLKCVSRADNEFFNKNISVLKYDFYLFVILSTCLSNTGLL